MFDNVMKFFKKFSKDKEEKKDSKTAAKERLHLVLMQDRANVSADFMELMKQEIIEVIKKYIDVDENAIDVKLTNKQNSDGTTGAPILYANIPILNVKDDTKQLNIERKKEEKEDSNIAKKEEIIENKRESTESKDSNQDEGKEDKKQEENKVQQENDPEEIRFTIEKDDEDAEKSEKIEEEQEKN